MSDKKQRKKSHHKRWEQGFKDYALALFFAEPSANDKPRVSEKNGHLLLQFSDASIQSEMDLEQPDHLVIAYTRSMMSFILLNPEPSHIAMIGLGGGALAKYCYRYLPYSEMTVVEINPDVIALRDEFAIPADNYRFNIVQQDGALFVADPTQQFDILLVDGFDKGGLPNALSSQQFYDNCHARLSAGGLMLVNLWANNKYYPNCIERIRHSFDEQLIIVPTTDTSNNIAIAFKGAKPDFDAEQLRQYAKILNKTHSIDFVLKAERLIKAGMGI